MPTSARKYIIKNDFFDKLSGTRNMYRFFFRLFQIRILVEIITFFRCVINKKAIAFLIIFQ